MGLEDLANGFNIDELAEKAQGLMGNVPDDVKNQAENVIDGLTEKLPDGIEDQAKGAVDSVKDMLGF